MTQNTNVNAQPFRMDKSVTFNVSNETPEDKAVPVVWAVRDRFGGILQKEKTVLSVSARFSVWIEKRELPDMEIRNRNENLVLDDNYFDMNAGERRVKVICGEREELTARSVFDNSVVKANRFGKLRIENANGYLKNLSTQCIIDLEVIKR